MKASARVETINKGAIDLLQATESKPLPVLASPSDNAELDTTSIIKHSEH